MDAMDYGNESDYDPMSTDMLEDICEGSQSHPNVNSREAHYKKRDCIKQRQMEWKGALKATRKVVKCLHKVFKTLEKEISLELIFRENLVQKFLISFQNLETLLK